ncbi:MAG: hypothetical protein WC517_01625 [Patescibacteria group bacterium]
MNHQYLKKSIISIVSLAVIFFIFGASPILASSGDPYAGLITAVGETGLDKNSNVLVIAGTIVKGVLSLLGVALVLVLIYAGIMWGFLSANDSKKVQTAKDIIKNAIIGLVIVMAAYAITIFIFGSIGATGSSQSPSPTDTVWTD